MPKTKTTKAPAEKKSDDAKKPTKTVKVAKEAKKVKKTVAAEPAPIPSADKADIINLYAVKDGDTGSPEVQAALLTNRIEKLVSHLKTNPSDNHSRRGLLGIVSKRRRLLHYLEEKSEARYKDLIKKLGLSK